MGKGGYQILDITKYGNITETGVQGEKGIYDSIESATVPIMITFGTLDGVDSPAQFAVPTFREGIITFVLAPGGRILNITSNDHLYVAH